MQGQIDATNLLAGYAKTQSEKTSTLADNSGKQATASSIVADATKSAAQTADQTLHVSQRAYITTGSPDLDLGRGMVHVPLLNGGHIPSGPINVILHEITYSYPTPDRVGVQSTSSERHWNQQGLPAVPPGIAPFRYSTTIPSAVSVQLQSGLQSVFIAGVVSYNDGFEGTKERYWQFCFNTSLRGTPKELVWVSCDAATILPKMIEQDGYPKNEDQNQIR